VDSDLFYLKLLGTLENNITNGVKYVFVWVKAGLLELGGIHFSSDLHNENLPQVIINHRRTFNTFFFIFQLSLSYRIIATTFMLVACKL